MNKTFRTFWETFNKTDDKLSERQLSSVQDKIEGWDNRHVKFSDKVRGLQRAVPKLREQSKAERVIVTEDKRNESNSVKSDASELGFTSYKIMLSNHACKTCRDFTNNGTKIFKLNELKKGQWDVPPIHPRCECILLPEE
jgi:hypothetical protein